MTVLLVVSMAIVVAIVGAALAALYQAHLDLTDREAEVQALRQERRILRAEVREARADVWRYRLAAGLDPAPAVAAAAREQSMRALTDLTTPTPAHTSEDL